MGGWARAEDDKATEWIEADEETILGLLKDDGGTPPFPLDLFAPHVTPLTTLEIELRRLSLPVRTDPNMDAPSPRYMLPA